MQGSSLRFYMPDNHKHRGMLLCEWLLEQAKQRGIHGDSAFRASAGCGRHGVLQERHFFELAGETTVLVECIVSDRLGDELLRIARADGAHLFYARLPAEFGVIDEADRTN